MNACIETARAFGPVAGGDLAFALTVTYQLRTYLRPNEPHLIGLIGLYGLDHMRMCAMPSPHTLSDGAAVASRLVRHLPPAPERLVVTHSCLSAHAAVGCRPGLDDGGYLFGALLSAHEQPVVAFAPLESYRRDRQIAFREMTEYEWGHLSFSAVFAPGHAATDVDRALVMRMTDVWNRSFAERFPVG